MNDLFPYGETADALIAHMRSCDFTVTKSELARWHRAGLLPRPQRYSLGRGRGMVSVYPTGTTDQLLALCIIHRSEKRLPYVAWRLWWEDYSVPIPSIRQFLEGARAQWQQGAEELRHLQEHPEQLSKLLDRITVMRLARGTFAQGPKRVSRKHFPKLLGGLVCLALGTVEGLAFD